MADSTTLREPGRRERSKQDRLNRIKQAARTLFVKHGYDATTTRAIARSAKVGLGTIFRHVEDKSDLLILLFEEDHEQVTEAAFANLPPDGPFLDRLMTAFRSYYLYFAREPEFSRAVLREVTFYAGQMRLGRTVKAGDRITSRIERLIADARERGEIASDESDSMIALLIFEIYQAECRRWLHDHPPDVEQGLNSLRRSLSLIDRGLKHAE
jgi:AcrR family transcriptional regulator